MAVTKPGGGQTGRTQSGNSAHSYDSSVVVIFQFLRQLISAKSCVAEPDVLLRLRLLLRVCDELEGEQRGDKPLAPSSDFRRGRKIIVIKNYCA